MQHLPVPFAPVQNMFQWLVVPFFYLMTLTNVAKSYGIANTAQTA